MRVERKDLVVGKMYKMLTPGNIGRFVGRDVLWITVAFYPVEGDSYVVDEDGLMRFSLHGDALEEVED